MSEILGYTDATSVVYIILDAWDITKEGKVPDMVGMYADTPGSSEQWWNYGESIMFKSSGDTFSQPGVEQMYVEETYQYELTIATVSSEYRYRQMVRGLQRICLAFEGNAVYSRLYMSDIIKEMSPFYFVGHGSITGYLNLAKRS